MTDPERLRAAEEIARDLADDFAAHEMQTFGSTRPYFEKIVAAAIQFEREAAAKIAETIPSWIIDDPEGGNAFDAGYVAACRRIANTLRSLFPPDDPSPVPRRED